MLHNGQLSSMFLSIFSILAILLAGIGAVGLTYHLRKEHTKESPYMLLFGMPFLTDAPAFVMLLVDIYKRKRMAHLRPWLLAIVIAYLMVLFMLVVVIFLRCLNGAPS